MGWLTGWSYRQKVNISASAGAGTGYQVEVDVTKIGLNSHCSDDFGDVRFTATDGSTELSYHLVSSVSGVSANFKVKVTDDLSTLAGYVYIYYGKAGAVTTSSALNTYDWYDDTSTMSTLRAGLYTKRNIQGASSPGTLIYDGTGPRYYCAMSSPDAVMWEFPALSGNNFEVQADYKFDQITGQNVQFGVCGRYSASGLYFIRDVQAQVAAVKMVDTNREPNPPNQAGTVEINTTTLTNYKVAANWYTMLARIYGNNLFGSVWDLTSGSPKTVQSIDSNYASGSFGIFIFSGTSFLVSFRNVIVRHYVSPEPAVTSFGGEEVQVPDVPVLVSPNGGATGIDADAPLSWNPASGASYYEVEIATDAGFSSVVFDNSGIAATSVVVPLPYRTLHYWHVRSIGSTGGISAYSTARSFTTKSITTSRIDEMMADVKTELLAITVGGGYKTTVVRVEDVVLDIDALSSLPVISLMHDREQFFANSTKRRNWDTKVDVLILAYVFLSKMEDFVEDLKRVIAGMALKYATQVANRWFIPSPEFIVARDMMFGSEKGWVSARFPVIVFDQDSSFAA